MERKLPIRRDPKTQATRENLDPELERQRSARDERRRAEQRAKRPRATYDLPREIIDAITEISKEESVPRSNLAAWALAEFVLRYYEGNIDLEPYKENSDSLRYDWCLKLPEHLSLNSNTPAMSP